MNLLDFDIFTHVVHCSSSRDGKTPYACDSDYLVYCYDMPDSEIAPHFPDVVQYMTEAENSSKNGNSPHLPVRVMVHCKQGVSRSASCILAYMMKTRRYTLKKGLQILKEARPCICPNQGFAYQLLDYEKATLGANSLNFKEMVKNEWAAPKWDRGNDAYYN